MAIWTLPKFTLAGLAPSDPDASPDPVSVTVAPVALPENATLPFKLPADCGENVTVKLAVCAGDKVIGRFRPLTAYAVPWALAWEIVMLAPPVLVRVPL